MTVADLSATAVSPSWLARVANGAAQPTAIPVKLAAGELHTLAGDHRWCLILCRAGSVWITQERDLGDYVMDAEQAFLVTLPGQIVIQARQPAVIEVTQPLQKSPYAGRQFGSIFP